MTWRYDVISTHEYMHYNIFKISNQMNHGNMKRIIFPANLQAEIGETGFVTSWHDVMKSRRHDVITLHNWKINNTIELGDPKNHRNKKRINFLAYLQAEIGETGFVTSWHDVMKSWRHDVRTLHKCKINNTVELGDPKNHRYKKESTF